MTLMYREDRSAPRDFVPLSRFRESFMIFFSHAGLRATAIVDMATYFAFGAFETFLPLVLASHGLNAFQTGIIFAVQVLIIAGTKPFFGKLADQFDKRVQIAAGLIIIGCSVAAIPLVASFTLFLVVSATLGLGMSLSTVATSAYVADIAQKEQIGASMGALSSIMDIGQSAGPLVTGIIITAVGFALGFFASFLLAIAVTTVFVLSVWKRD
jgi:MFS family permease